VRNTLLALAGVLFLAQAHAQDAETGTLEVVVRDARGRPVAGAVAWVPGVKPRTPIPDDAAVLNQEGLAFRPSLLVARKGQKIEFRNSDPEVHNVHAGSPCCAWNFSVTSGKSEIKVLDEACEVTLLCDIHVHMRAELLVIDADFARTDATGVARLAGVPLGKRRVQVRAADLVAATVNVDVTAGINSVAVALAAPPPAPSVVPPEKLPWPALAAGARDSLEESLRASRAGDADRAREKADEADGKWFSGSGFFDELRRFDAESANPSHRRRCEELRGALRRFKREVGLAAAPGPERDQLLEKLDGQAERLAQSLLEAARQLPKREAR
jgi:plastocyanin